MKVIYILFFILGIHNSFNSQIANISGQIVNSKNQPVAFASIKFLNANGILVKGFKTKLDGQFSGSIDYGQYSMECSFIGYRPYKREIKIQESELKLGKIELKENTTQLGEIVVSGTRSTKASAIDKKEYSPTQLLSSQNASAAELINAIPSINMGNESNNVSFRGDENVAVMINGKISSLTGQNLSQIPATSIEKIEVISVPNSKYNSEGSAGVINIVLKKTSANFSGGYLLGSIGNNNKYNTQLGYNWNINKLAIAASYNFTYNEFWNSGWSKREYLSNIDLNSYRHVNDGLRIKRLHAARIGMDYEFNKRNSLSFMANLSRDWGSSSSEDHDTFRTVSQAISQQWKLFTEEEDVNTLYDINLAYSHWMSNMKDKWTFEISRSDNMNDKTIENVRAYDIYSGISQSILNQFSIENLQRRPITAFQTDYLLNINTTQQLEMGLRGANRAVRFTNLYREYGMEISKWSNDFSYDENIFSLYGLLSSNWTNRLTSKLGLRMEQTNTQSFNYNIALYQNNYFYAFPSAMLRYQVSNTGYLTSSYSMRINRPSPGSLNPLQDVADPISKRLGNPKLQPEIINSFELGYGQDVSKAFSFSSSAYFKLSNNSITRFLSTNSDGTIFVVLDNIGKSSFSGIEAIANVKLSKAVSINLSSNISYNTLSYQTTTNLYEQSYINYQGRGILNIKLPWSLEGQIIAFYKSPMKTPQGDIHFMSNVDISLRKKLFNQNGLLILSVFDIFNDTKFRLNNSDNDFVNEFERKRETRYTTLSFRYNFGRENNSKKPKIEKSETRDSGGDMGM